MHADYSRYIQMQKEVYNRDLPSEAIVGNYSWNEAFPYETLLLHINGDVRYPIFEDFKARRCLDFGCGPGRMVRRMKRIFGQADGVDISEKLIAEARAELPDSNFWVTSGDDLGDAPRNAYDFVFCTIAMQHIAVHDVKMSILRHIHEVLKPGGKATLQFSFNRHFPYSTVVCEEVMPGGLKVILHAKDPRHAAWRENRVDAEDTNSQCDGAIGYDDLPFVEEDFESIFGNVRFWFHDFTHFKRNLTDYSRLGRKTGWASHMIFIHAVKE